MTAHVDLDGLADLLVGEGDDAHVAHVGDCAACSAQLVELADAQEEVTTALAALPEPVPPPGLADRLVAALRAAGDLGEEHAVSSAGPLRAVADDADPSDRATVGPDGDDRDRRHGRPGPAAEEPRRAVVVPLRSRRRPARLLTAAAGITAVLLGGAVVVVSALGDRAGQDKDTASSALTEADAPAGASGSSSAAGPESGMAAPSTLAMDGALAAARTASGRDYATGDLSADELAAAGAARALAPTGGALDRLLDPAELAGCLAANGLSTPTVLDYAAYAGAPALAVVSPAADPAALEVVVVGAACSADRPDRLAAFPVAP